jgi:hypothetical protein
VGYGIIKTIIKKIRFNSMKIRILSAFLLLAGIKCFAQTLPKVASGSIRYIENSLSGYSRISGGAACFSTPLPGISNTKDHPISAGFFKYLKDDVPVHKSHKLYFEYGTETLDPNYKPTRQQADKIMKLKGYTPIIWINKEFPGAAPIETVWNTRFYVSVKFLLGK